MQDGGHVSANRLKKPVASQFLQALNFTGEDRVAALLF